MRPVARKNTTKVFASIVLVGGAAAVAGLGTFGSFTSTTSASEDVSTATVKLNQGASVRGLDVPATGMVPGDYADRAVTLVRDNASDTFGSVAVTTTASTPTVLTTDLTNGLQLTVDQCSVAWVKDANTNDLNCSGTTTSVVAQRAVLGNNIDLGAATTALNGAGKTAYLRVKVSLPTTADDTFQGKSSTIGFSFTALQRAGQAR